VKGLGAWFKEGEVEWVKGGKYKKDERHGIKQIKKTKPGEPIIQGGRNIHSHKHDESLKGPNQTKPRRGIFTQ